VPACLSEFEPLLLRFDPEELDNHYGAIFGLLPDLRLAAFNRSWFDFARDNGGEPAISRDWPLGRSVLDAVPEPLRPFYEQAFTHCLSSGSPWEHEYECSSPEVYRWYHQRLLPLGDGDGLLVVNSLLVENAHPAGSVIHQVVISEYMDNNGYLHQCAHCRRVLFQGSPERWDFVAEWVRHFPKNTSHTLCPVCYRYYYTVPRTST
jgi:hypothetical protein